MTIPRKVAHLVFSVAVADLLIGSGCVAFNVGKPETFTHTVTVEENQTAPIRSEVVSVSARQRMEEGKVVVSLGAEIREEFEKWTHPETITVRKQRRLAIGLYPGAGEIFLMPSEALQSSVLYNEDQDFGSGLNSLHDPGQYLLLQSFGMVLTCGVPQIIGTLYSVFAAPFDDWACHHELIDSDVSYECQLRSFPFSDQYRMGFNTKSVHVKGGSRPPPFLHCGLVGCHKYLAVFVDGPEKGMATVTGTETKLTSAEVPGPFIAEFEIQELNFKSPRRVTAHSSEASFALPAVERDCTVEAVVSFREDSSVNGRNASDFTRKALAKAAGQRWKGFITLKGTGRPDTGFRPPARPPEKLFDVVTVERQDDGRFLARVEIKDKSKTFSILHLIKAEVFRLAREDFRKKYPSEPAEFLRESMDSRTEEDGKFLSFTGWVFSVRPVEDGWFYDDQSRTGWVRLRVTGGIPAAEAERWAHENIGEIVKNKNVVLETGTAPPSGAQFRSRSERCEDGVLTVEFEAVQ